MLVEWVILIVDEILFKVLKDDHLNIILKFSNDLINVFYPLTFVALPIVLTIFNFIYKERKAISYQTLQPHKKTLNYFVWGTIVFNLIIYLLIYINSLIHNKDFEISSNIVAVSVFLSFFLIIILMIITYIKLWNSINIFKLVEKHIKIGNKRVHNIEKVINKKILFSNLKKKRLRKYLVEYGISNQIIGQVLLAQMEYNLTTSFSETLNTYFENQRSFFELVNHKYATEILEYYGYNSKSKVYNETLDINLMILDKIAETMKRNEIDIILSQYTYLIPGKFEPSDTIYEKDKAYTDNMHHIYLQEERHFYKNLIYAYETVSLQTEFEKNSFLNELLLKSNDSYVYLKAVNIFSLYTVLIIKSVYSKDLKVLTNFVNLAITLENNERINHSIKDSEVSYSYNTSLAKLLIVAILKSIELGHNSCTGFLIKVAVNHQDSINLNETVTEFYKVMAKQVQNNTLDVEVNLKTEDVNEVLLKDMNFKVNISSRSWDYCYYKMVHLINKQQIYMFDLHLLSFRHNDILDTEAFPTEHSSRVNRSYMDNKLNNMSKEYGMVSLVVTDKLK